MSARVLLSRDRAFADFIRRYDVLIDGKVAGKIKNGGVFEHPVSAGKHAIQLRVDFCGSNIIEFEVADGGLVQFECGSNLRGWRLLQAQRIMRESPNEWIWLKGKGNAI